MDLKPTFEHYFPEGTKGGQCGVFAHKLVDFPLIGNSLASKIAAVNKYGIPISKLNGDFRVGDVVITKDNLTNGHVFTVNNVMEPNIRATDSNWKNDERVMHNRLVPKTAPTIVGVIRGPLKVQVINPQPAMTEIKMVVVDNRQEYPDLDVQLINAQKLVSEWSANKLKLTITRTVKTFYENIPYETVSQGIGGVFKLPTRDWQRANVFPYLDDADIVLFISKESMDTVEQGYCLAPSIENDPYLLYVETTVSPKFFQEFGLTEFTKITIHELSHAVRIITGLDSLPIEMQHDVVDSWTHYYDYTTGHSLKESFGSTMNYDRLYTNLLLLRRQRKGEPMIIIHKKSDANTKFVLENDFKRGYSDFTAFQNDTAGRQVIDLALDDAEFAKIPTSKAVIKT